ncbi:hypothetical protein [Spirochaeta isovalerica]|uniref:Uncharacterized protein n=1 Tax=Spirochaeta isovalerica TaxID=150 RepID=A0A841RE16_9SPIO|nr:hypothetical protein [Spirochaeta isovalerica]MBB6480868.1 hypothetical protein [Spirochaeta isovalerica]
MKIKGLTAGLTFIILMIGGIAISVAAGYWATESSKEPVRYETGDFAGEYNPADIRGSYSFEDIENAFAIPVDTLAAAFGLSSEENPVAIQIKLFEDTFGIIDGMEIGTDSMRYFVSLYKGLPYTPEVTTALPRPAIAILRKEGALTEEELAIAEERAVTLDDYMGETVLTETEDHDETELAEVKGKTTFADLYDWGLTVEQVETVLQMAAGPRTQTVRDFCTENQIEFSTVKEPLQELLDSM